MTVSTWKTFRAVLHTADADPAAEVPIYINDAAHTVVAADVIVVEGAMFCGASATTTGHVYFSTDGTLNNAWDTIIRGAAGGGRSLSMTAMNHDATGKKIYAIGVDTEAMDVIIWGKIKS